MHQIKSILCIFKVFFDQINKEKPAVVYDVTLPSFPLIFHNKIYSYEYA